VFAFEPSPDTAALLAKHLKINRKRNVTIVQKAVAGRTGEMRFSSIGVSRERRLHSEGDTKVVSVTLDQVVRGLPPPACIKMDIEGAEVEALQAAVECFERYKPKLFLATHGTDVPCCALLRSWGYRVEFFAGPDLLALPESR
jgi:FkbM family methyltransferase